MITDNVNNANFSKHYRRSKIVIIVNIYVRQLIDIRRLLLEVLMKSKMLGISMAGTVLMLWKN